MFPRLARYVEQDCEFSHDSIECDSHNILMCAYMQVRTLLDAAGPLCFNLVGQHPVFPLLGSLVTTGRYAWH